MSTNVKSTARAVLKNRFAQFQNKIKKENVFKAADFDALANGFGRAKRAKSWEKNVKTLVHTCPPPPDFKSFNFDKKAK